MATVANETGEIVLSTPDLREVTGYPAESAQEVLEIFERAHPADSRPRGGIDAAWTFARGGKRGKTLRDTAWAALRAARDADTAAAAAAARRPAPGAGSPPRGRAREVVSAGRHCATPRGRRLGRPETQTPRPRPMRREQRCARHPLRTCIQDRKSGSAGTP